jgi:hypothetical protein
MIQSPLSEIESDHQIIDGGGGFCGAAGAAAAAGQWRVDRTKDDVAMAEANRLHTQYETRSSADGKWR